MTETPCTAVGGFGVPPRWEWRTFAPCLAELEGATGFVAQGPPRRSEELYLTHANSPHNAKIRDALLDVKRLKTRAASGLELWEVAMKLGFPLSAPDILSFFAALDLAPPSIQGRPHALEEFAQREFLDDIIGRDLAFRAASVTKSRRSFMFAGCRAEFVHLKIGGSDWTSFCVEDECPARLDAALRALGLDPAANVNFPKFLKSLPLQGANSSRACPLNSGEEECDS